MLVTNKGLIFKKRSVVRIPTVVASSIISYLPLTKLKKKKDSEGRMYSSRKAVNHLYNLNPHLHLLYPSEAPSPNNNPKNRHFPLK